MEPEERIPDCEYCIFNDMVDITGYCPEARKEVKKIMNDYHECPYKKEE